MKVIEKFPQVIVISDEIYEHITFTGKHISLATFSSIADRVVTVNGVSKGYAMTGWRIGYMGAPLWLAKACNKLQGQFTSGVCSIAQRAALAAVTSKSDSKERMREAFLRRRDLICSLLGEIPGLKVRVPQGAFYVMPDISTFIGKSYNGQVMKDADDLTFFLLAEAQGGYGQRKRLRGGKLHQDLLRHLRRQDNRGRAPHKGSACKTQLSFPKSSAHGSTY